MSDPNPAAPPVKARPSTVTISSYLLFLTAALQVVGLIVALSVTGTMQQVYEDAYADFDGMEAIGTITTVTTIAGAIFGLLVAAGLVVLALLNNRGKNPSRIVTWVLGGIFLCCSGGGLALGAAGSALTPDTSGTDPNMPDPAQVQRDLEAALPGWYDPVNLLVGVVTVLALLAALILLALPPSNEFFRKPAVAWEPPVPGGGYGGVPPMPGGAYPSYPPAPGTPPGPPPAAGPPPTGGNPPAAGDTPDNPSGNPPGSQPPSGS
ncbi:MULTISPECIES: hypothetical protein [unclassified Solwaraspora]|uniref:hypothetical protein n=1 Tax=unclassified Solwaraspora TaxID=2627926 RepID=UPI00259B5298|nr:hypothetical protein [Solwaraspora sp. WMMA2056]WJK41613.1 hypothetical protein O7608_04075 [Solwaraspora sp. WMMA2056]